MKNKLKLNELKIKSFITLESNDQLLIKAGEIGSEGPSHSTHVDPSVSCATCSVHSDNCGQSNGCNSGSNQNQSYYCDHGSHEMTN